jgi:hypothetical protein
VFAERRVCEGQDSGTIKLIVSPQSEKRERKSLISLPKWNFEHFESVEPEPIPVDSFSST